LRWPLKRLSAALVLAIGVAPRYVGLAVRIEAAAESMCRAIVYLLESVGAPARRYVGSTSDLKRRFAEHNAGQSPHTSKFIPWRLVIYVAFSDRDKATAFERYLKSGSGHAFANKHLRSLLR
jgi:putative endonuclease